MSLTLLWWSVYNRNVLYLQCVDAFINDFKPKPKYRAAYVFFTDCEFTASTDLFTKNQLVNVIFINSDIFITVISKWPQTVLMSSSTRWRRTVANTLKCVKRSTSRFCHRKHKWVYLEIHVAWSGWVFYCLWPCFMGHLCRCLPVITQRPSRASTIRTVRTEIRRWRWSPIRS